MTEATATEVPTTPAEETPAAPVERRLDEVLRAAGDGVVSAAPSVIAAIGDVLAAVGPPEQPVRPADVEPWIVPDRLTAAALLAAGCPFDAVAVTAFKPMAYAVPDVADWSAFCAKMSAGAAELTAADRKVLQRIRWLVEHPGKCEKTDAACAWHEENPPTYTECAAVYWKHGRLRSCLHGIAIPPCSAEARTVQRETARRLALGEFKDEIFKLEGKLVSLLGASVGVVLGSTKRVVRFVDWLDGRLTRSRDRMDER